MIYLYLTFTLFYMNSTSPISPARLSELIALSINHSLLTALIDLHERFGHMDDPADVAELDRALFAITAAKAATHSAKVWACTIANEPGVDVTVHLTEDGAYKEAYQYVKDQWDSEYPEDKMPSTMRGAVHDYFEGEAVEGRESLTIEQVDLKG